MKKITAFSLSLILGLAQPDLHAAVSGQLESDSAGEIEVRLQIVPSLQIDTVKVLDLTITNRLADAHFSERFCVTGTANTRYNVSAYGSGPNNRLVLQNQQGNQLEYEFFFRGNPGSATLDRLTPGKASPAYETFDEKSGCEEATVFRITFRAAELQSAEAGLYTGHVTLIVSPV